MNAAGFQRDEARRKHPQAPVLISEIDFGCDRKNIHEAHRSSLSIGGLSSDAVVRAAEPLGIEDRVLADVSPSGMTTTPWSTERHC